MKKLLVILGAFGIAASGGSTVIACGHPSDKATSIDIDAKDQNIALTTKDPKATVTVKVKNAGKLTNLAAFTDDKSGITAKLNSDTGDILVALKDAEKSKLGKAEIKVSADNCKDVIIKVEVTDTYIATFTNDKMDVYTLIKEGNKTNVLTVTGTGFKAADVDHWVIDTGDADFNKTIKLTNDDKETTKFNLSFNSDDKAIADALVNKSLVVKATGVNKKGDTTIVSSASFTANIKAGATIAPINDLTVSLANTSDKPKAIKITNFDKFVNLKVKTEDSSKVVAAIDAKTSSLMLSCKDGAAVGDFKLTMTADNAESVTMDGKIVAADKITFQVKNGDKPVASGDQIKVKTGATVKLTIVNYDSVKDKNVKFISADTAKVTVAVDSKDKNVYVITGVAVTEASKDVALTLTADNANDFTVKIQVTAQ